MSIRQCARTMKHTVLIAAMFAAATSASLAAAEKRQFEVAAGSAVQALNEFSRQANIQLLFDSDAVRGFRTQGVSGELEVADALAQLLGGTSLVYEFVNERTVVVMLEGAAPAKSQRTSSAGRTNEYTRLAQVDDGSSQSSSSAVSAATSESLERQRIELEEVIVTGTNIRGVYPSSSPVEIYTAEDIARLGATTTEQFVERVPQNLGTQNEFAATSSSDLNREGVTGVNLRGLGVGTTLTLLNGRRLALANNGQMADVSMIPASAIARVEVLTDGASAIYGSDAVGGVMNFVLREDFDGAETRLSYGSVTSGDMDRISATQTNGGAWRSGHGLVSLDYYSASPLSAADRPFSADTVYGDTPTGAGYLTPDIERYSGLATASQEFGERLSADSVVAFSRRDVTNLAVGTNGLTAVAFRSQSDQYFVDLGADYRFSDSLNASIVASYSDINVENTWGQPGVTVLQDFSTKYSVLDMTATLDGTLFALPAGQMRFVLGGDYLDEEYWGARTLGPGTTLSGRDLGRGTVAAFGELFVPLIGDMQDVPLVHRLELSLAARYTRYEDASEPSLGRDFGDRVSPKIGVLWAPFESLNLRGTYGESFRAPSLAQLDPSGTVAALQQGTPINGVSATVLSAGGVAPDLDAELARTYTIGFDFRPTGLPGFRLSTTYFNIEYEDRIGRPSTVPARANPSAWPEIIHQPAAPAEIEEILRSYIVSSNNTGISVADPQAAAQALFARLPDFWIINNLTRNIALYEQDGFDLALDGRFGTSWGAINVGSHMTYILNFEEQASPSSPIVTLVDTVLRPADLKGNVYAGVSWGGLTSQMNVNYVDDYHSPFATTLDGGPHAVESWTTVDWILAYDFGLHARWGLLKGLRLNLTVNNLFNEPPPLVVRTTAVPNLGRSAGFDPANANPIGRFVTLGISKAW